MYQSQDRDAGVIRSTLTNHSENIRTGLNDIKTKLFLTSMIDPHDLCIRGAL